MQKKFTENESYKHKMAKDVLREWFYGGKSIGDIGIASGGGFTPNRNCGVWFEYPIVVSEKWNSIYTLSDEIFTNPKITKELSEKYENECKIFETIRNQKREVLDEYTLLGDERGWWDSSNREGMMWVCKKDPPQSNEYKQYCNLQHEYVPTYEECINFGFYPTRMIDVVLIHKGQPFQFIEICHTNPVSQEKIDELRKLGVDNLIEIKAEWIMKQTKRPTKIQYKRLI